MQPAPDGSWSRRSFLQTLTAAGLLTAVGLPTGRAVEAAGRPWHQRALRWGQTNLTEIDPLRFDLSWWRQHWQRTAVQGVVVNAGGIVAYYPTEVPGHRRAEHLGGRDLFGEICAAAQADGLAVFARMDSNRADASFYAAHPDWFARDAAGQPYLVSGLYVACVNGPYYEEHIPAILREVAERYRPEGFTDNNWNGPMRHQPCYCSHCERRFRARGGRGIPREVNWDDPIYRDWIMWNYERRLEIWDQFNAITRTAGGPDCLWVGMMAGSQNWQARVFRDDREIYRRTELIMLDDQRRFDEEGFQHNGEIGKRLRSVGGWNKIIPESMAMYHLTEHNFRLAAKPEPEVRMWVVEGIAGGVQPWWHHVGSDQHDRRMLRTATPLWQWHREHEPYLVNRLPVATVGLLWSQRNMDFFGRDDGSAHVDEPWNGWMQALIRGRIPYVPVHVDDVEREVAALGLRALILPNVAALSDAQLAALRRFVANGGSLIATGLSSLCTEWGEVRPDFGLTDVLGVRLPDDHPWRDVVVRTKWAKDWAHTYLRLRPERRGGVEGPRSGDEPASDGERHPVLEGWAETDILAFGGRLAPLHVQPGADIPLTYVPPVPVTPVESVWMREPVTEVPGLVLRATAAGGRVAYLAADVDRQFARENLPDHGDLLARLTRWVLADDVPLRVTGSGLVDCHLYRQPGRLILHLVNLTSAGTWRTPVHELIPIGPLQVSVRLREGSAVSVRSLVTGETRAVTVEGGWGSFTVERVLDHDVVVIA